MAIINQSELPATAEPAIEITPEQDTGIDKDEPSFENVSEVAMRINLLGKLIIPPPAP